ncbi:MAG: hypothetical protein M5U07_17065 [Xanthobacteraceae bacterium]|nr:hypothetical protein [Xanthobacteraceae bacterium]
MQEAAAPAGLDQQRSRLVDHFKRAYQIIVGLAITLACTRLVPDGVPSLAVFSDTSFWLFCTFFITVVPIFHGGDRSLDIKYLGAAPKGFWGQAGYVWDVYMLLITAILFVKIAQSIPVPQAPSGGGLLALAPPSRPDMFYRWMAVMLFFDAWILLADSFKSDLRGGQGLTEQVGAYVPWIVLNIAFGLVCWFAQSPPGFFASLSALAISILVFACAFARTVLDYVFGRRFMFP